VLVGTDRANEPARPFWVAWTPDGKEIIVPNTATNNVSIVDLDLALAGKPGAEVARIPLNRPDGAPARPKVVAVTADGRYATVTGGDDTQSQSLTNMTGMVYVIDIRARRVVAANWRLFTDLLCQLSPRPFPRLAYVSAGLP